MVLSLVPRSARALAEHLNNYYRVLKGIDQDSVAVRLDPFGSFEVRHSVTSAPVLRVTDAGIVSAINGANISAGTITSAQISNGTIVGADIAAATITPDKLTGLSGVPAGAITTVEIANGTILAADIAPGAITTAEIADGTLLATDVAPGQLPVLLQRFTLAAPTPSVTFPAITQAYSALELRIYGRVTGAVVSEACYLRPNNDSASNYYGQQSVAASGAVVTAADLGVLSYLSIGSLPGTASSNVLWAGRIKVTLSGYGTTLFKTIEAENYLNTNVSANNATVRTYAGTWAQSGHITSVVVAPISSQFDAGTVVSLYGIP